MKKLIMIIQVLCAFSCYGKYDYAVYSEDDNVPVNMSYIIDRELFVVGHVLNKTVYKDCSTREFICLKTKSERFYVPKNIELGVFKSEYGKLKVLNKITDKLPFDIKGKYFLIEYYDNAGEPDYRVYYSKERGILAFIHKTDSGKFKQIAWLTSECGLLSHCNIK